MCLSVWWCFTRSLDKFLAGLAGLHWARPGKSQPLKNNLLPPPPSRSIWWHAPPSPHLLSLGLISSASMRLQNCMARSKVVETETELVCQAFPPVRQDGCYGFHRPLYIFFWYLSCDFLFKFYSRTPIFTFLTKFNFFSPNFMILSLSSQIKMLATKTTNRIPIAIAAVVIIFLGAVWHGRGNIPDHPLRYIKGFVKDSTLLKKCWLIIADIL